MFLCMVSWWFFTPSYLEITFHGDTPHQKTGWGFKRVLELPHITINFTIERRLHPKVVGSIWLRHVFFGWCDRRFYLEFYLDLRRQRGKSVHFGCSQPPLLAGTQSTSGLGTLTWFFFDLVLFQLQEKSNTGNNQKWVNWRWSIGSNRWFICLSSLISSFSLSRYLFFFIKFSYQDWSLPPYFLRGWGVWKGTHVWKILGRSRYANHTGVRNYRDSILWFNGCKRSI